MNPLHETQNFTKKINAKCILVEHQIFILGILHKYNVEQFSNITN